jgi:hypothetical protein
MFFFTRSILFMVKNELYVNLKRLAYVNHGKAKDDQSDLISQKTHGRADRAGVGLERDTCF